jgi:hypothetical protein
MAIQFTNEFYFSTPGNDIATSASGIISYSFWFQSNGAISVPFCYLFQKVNPGLITQMFATNQLSVAINGTNGGISHSITVVPNTPYFVVVNFAPGAQSLYVNGVLTVSGSLAGLVNSGNTALNLGCQQSQSPPVGITLGQPAIYNYALTSTNVVDLLLGTYTPATLPPPASPVGAATLWAPSFKGTLGATPAVGDTGLANGGSKGAGTGNEYVLGTLTQLSGTAEYVADLGYTNPSLITAYVSNTGKMIFFFLTDPTGITLQNVTAVSSVNIPAVFVNGSAITLGPAIWSNNTLDTPYVAYALPSAVLQTDVITYTLPVATFTTAGGFSGPIPTPTSAGNYTGLNEPGIGPVDSFTSSPVMKLGVNIGQQEFAESFNFGILKNARYRTTPPGNLVTGGGVTYDSNLQPLTLAPGTLYSCGYYNTADPNGIDSTGYPSPVGVHSIVFDDVNANNANALVVFFSGNKSICTGTDNLVPGDTNGSTYVRTVVGTTVTVSYNIGYVASPSTLNMALNIGVKSPLGNFGANDPTTGTPTITNYWIFQPGDSTTTMYAGYSGPFPNAAGNDRSKPYAMSANIKSWLTASNGNGPAILRFQEVLGGSGCVQNYQNYADCISPNAWTFSRANSKTATLAAARFLNTNPAKGPAGDGTYGWVSSKIYHPLIGADGTDSVGSYIDLTLHSGTTDFGNFLTNGGAINDTVAVEFRTTAPHGFRSGDIVVLGEPSTVNGGPLNYACTGGPQTVLSGTATVANGSTAITFSTAQTLNLGVPSGINPGILISSDSTGAVYRVSGVTAGGLTGTLFPTYQGTASSSATATLTPWVSPYNTKGSVWVTGADTFCVGLFSNATVSGSNVQTLVTTREIGATWVIQGLSNGALPNYGSMQALCAEWPGCISHFPGMPFMTDACLQSVANEIAANALPNSVIRWELGDEHWNNGFPTMPYCIVSGNLNQYLSPGYSINSYYTVPTGSPVLTNDQMYTLLSAHQHDVLQAEFDTLGTGIQVDRYFGGFEEGAGIAGAMIAFGTQTPSPTNGLQKKIPMGSIGIGLYVSVEGNSTYTTACSPTGGNLSCNQIIDWAKHFIKYASTGLWDIYSDNQAAIATYAANGGPTGYAGQFNNGPALVGYEGEWTQIDPLDGAMLQHDIWYSTGMAQAHAALLQSWQQGSPLVPNSGMQSIAMYHLGGIWSGANEQQLWSTGGIYHNQLAGTGSTNQFGTAQGGSPADGKAHDITNVVTQRSTYLDWFGAANGAGNSSARLGITESADLPLMTDIAITGSLAVTESADLPLMTSVSSTSSIAVTEFADVPFMRATALARTINVRPSKIPPNVSSPSILLTLIGTATSWTSGSSVSIQNSITGTTTVTAGTFTTTSATLATLVVTTGDGTGTWTIAIDGLVSPPLVVGSKRKGWFGGMNRLMRVG